MTKFVCAGVWPAFLTPLTEQGDVNHAAVEQLADLHARQKLGGLYVTGSTGQWPLLTVEQRRDIVERVIRTVARRVPVMVHVGATATDDAVALARHAEQAGADAVSSVTPIYYGFGADAIFETYRRIGTASSLPLFVYHLSIVNQLSMDARDYANRLLALPNIAGMKITDRDLYQFGLIHAYTAGRLQLFSGADEVMCQAVLSGAVGAIGSFYNLWGPACQKARAAFVAGNIEAGQRFMLAFQMAIAEILRVGGFWQFIRSALRLKYRIDIGLPRPPLAVTEKPWNDADVERLVAQVDSAAGL
jgi:N-acetylneuraminate lyase